MTSSIPVSAALLRTLPNLERRIDPAVVAAFETGAHPTIRASKGPTSPLKSGASSLKSRFGRKWQRSPDRAKSVSRRRRFGGCSSMPPAVRDCYTTGEAASLVIIMKEVIQHGFCDWPLDKIAANAGVSRTTVQNALRVARVKLHMSVQLRPRPGLKNLPNIVRIVSKEWLAWIESGIGFKSLHPTLRSNKQHKKEKEARAESKKEGALEAERAAAAAARAEAEALVAKLRVNTPEGVAHHNAALDAIRRAQGEEPDHKGPKLDLSAHDWTCG